MVNKYQSRRRALREAQSRSDSPFASPRFGEASQPESEPSLPQLDRPWLTAGICFGLVLLITMLYVQTWRHGFTVCDDNDYIYKNPWVTQGLNRQSVQWAWDAAHAGNWHPLTWMSHMLDYQVFGTWQPENNRYVDSWPGGHHLVGMVIHCANAALLFLALRLMTGTLWPCAAVAALFAVHPLRVESVAWAAERKDVLCGLFWMASMVSYAFYSRRRPLFQSSPMEFAVTLELYLLVTLFFGLGLLAKSMVVTLPCVFLLLDAWPLDRWRRALWPPGRTLNDGPNLLSASWLLVEKLPWAGMVIYDCWQTVVGQDKGVALNSWEGLPLRPRLVNALASVGGYLGQMFWPAGMAPFYPHPHMFEGGWNSWVYCQAAIGGVILAAVTGAVLWLWRKSYLAVGWFWFLGALMPVIGILQVGTQARADRYTYLPMIGVYLMLVWLLKEAADRWPNTRVLLAAAAAVVFATLSAITFQQVSYWRNSYTLFEHAVQVTDNNWFAYNHLGIQYDEDGLGLLRTNGRGQGDLPPSTQFALEKWGLQNTDPQTAGQILLDHSAESFKSSIDIKPDYDFGNNNLGVYYARKSTPEDLRLAEKCFRDALHSNQRYADAFNNLAIVLAKQGKLDEAITCHKLGFRVRDDRASDHNNLCRVYMQKHDLDIKNNEPEEAKTDLERALEENSIALKWDRNFFDAWMSRAEICLMQKNVADADKCVERMTAIDARSPATLQKQFFLAANYLDLNRPEEAIAWLNRILAVNLALPDVYNARGLAYLKKGDLRHAQEDFEQVLRLAPQFPGAQERLGAVRSQLAVPQK